MTEVKSRIQVVGERLKIPVSELPDDLRKTKNAIAKQITGEIKAATPELQVKRYCLNRSFAALREALSAGVQYALDSVRITLEANDQLLLDSFVKRDGSNSAEMLEELRTTAFNFCQANPETEVKLRFAVYAVRSATTEETATVSN